MQINHYTTVKRIPPLRMRDDKVFSSPEKQGVRFPFLSYGPPVPLPIIDLESTEIGDDFFDGPTLAGFSDESHYPPKIGSLVDIWV